MYLRSFSETIVPIQITVPAMLCCVWMNGCKCRQDEGASSNKSPKHSMQQVEDSEKKPGDTPSKAGLGSDSKQSKSPVPVPEGMVYQAEVKFPMGCDMVEHNYCRGDEVPQRVVSVSAFFIDKLEVSVERYQKCVDAGKCKKPDMYLEGDDYLGYCNYGRKGYEKHPINCVTWKQADSFCTWEGKRLLTEAEWERSARGSQGRIYPWGDSPEPSCEYATMFDVHSGTEGCGLNGTATVDSNEKGATSDGVMNLLGNVAEWIADFYTPNSYATLPNQNPRQDESGKNRVTRGGSFASEAKLLRNTKRHWIDPSSGYRGIGIRCGKSILAQ